MVCPVNIPSPMSVFNLLGGNNGADGKVEYFRYNEKTEKPKLSFAVPAIVDDNASPDSITVGLHTSSVYLPAIVHIWISGAAVMLLYSAISYLYLKRQVAASIPGKDNVYICDEIKNPFILGIVSPRVYLPSGMSEDVRQNVIAHERAHLKGGTICGNRLDIFFLLCTGSILLCGLPMFYFAGISKRHVMRG